MKTFKMVYIKKKKKKKTTTRVSCIAGRFFTTWATSEAQNKFNEDFLNGPHQKKKKKKRNPQTFKLSFYLPTFNNMVWLSHWRLQA